MTTKNVLGTEIQMPQFNLNGSSPNTYLADALVVLNSMREVLDNINKINPHGRDYQTLPDGCFKRAAIEHAERRRKLAQIYAEIEALAMQAMESPHYKSDVRSL